MSLRHVALAATLVGGVCWVLDLFVDLAPVRVCGAVLLGLAVAVGGALLVRAPWLRVVAGVGALVLAGSLVELLAGHYPDAEVRCVTGGVATLWVAGALLRHPASRDSSASG